MATPNPDDLLRTTDHVPTRSRETPPGALTTDARSFPVSSVTATFQKKPAESCDGSALHRSEPPASIPGYEIESVLGRGGMGVVYKARHLNLKRTVALKMVLAGGHAGPRELARFRIEAEAVARLQHPNIVQIHEVGEADGHPFCALEFVEGGNLATKLGRKPMPARDAARLVESLARAMQLAHSRNVVHRDLKPANILLTADGTPKITDFGLARQLDSDSGETQAGAVVGTPSYMAPEQASGQTHEAGPAADVYALGAILYDCLAGRPAFKGKTVVETLDQVRTREPAPPSRHQAGVPLDLDTICLKCLRKEPEQRYASAAELADELVRYQQGKPIQARPVGRIERSFKWVKRNPVVTALAAAVVLALAAGATVSTLKYLDAEQQKGIAEGKEKTANEEAAKAERAADYLVGIFELADANGRRGTMTARQILDDAEKNIPQEFQDQPELRDQLLQKIGAVYDKITAGAPLAMILEASGAVQLHSTRNPNQRATPQALLYTGDRLTLAADAQVRLIVLSDWHKERLRPGAEATIRRKGCEPADAVAERDRDPLMTFVRLPRGTFYMGWGSKPDNKAMITKGDKTEIREDFEIAVHDVTQGQWEAVMGGNPSHFSRFGPGRHDVQNISDEELKLLPVECVCWTDAQTFIRKLNQLEHGRGYLYRLPTQAEWEYACRGGASSEEECSYHFYVDKPTNDLSSDRANINGEVPFGDAPSGASTERTTRVGAYPPNKLGLCDMHGNVFQWCSDLVPYSPDRMARGGCWGLGGPYCQAGYGLRFSPSDRSNIFGFRLVRVPVPEGPPFGLWWLSTSRLSAEAIRQYQDGLHRISMNFTRHMELGDALVKRNDPEGAVREFREALRIDPDNAGAHRSLAHVLEAKDIDGAVREYREALRIDPNDALLHVILGNILRDKKDVPAAVHEYAEAQRIDPRSDLAHWCMGNILYDDKNDIEGAVREYTEVVRLNPGHVSANNRLAWLSATAADPALRDPKKALACARKAVELEPKNGEFRNTLGAAYYCNGEWREAVSELDQTLKLRPDGFNGTSYFFLAMAHWQLGEKDQARAWYEKGVQQAEKNAPNDSATLQRVRAEAASVIGVEASGPKDKN